MYCLDVVILPTSPLPADKAKLAKFKFSSANLSDVCRQHLAQRGTELLDVTTARLPLSLAKTHSLQRWKWTSQKAKLQGKKIISILKQKGIKKKTWKGLPRYPNFQSWSSTKEPDVTVSEKCPRPMSCLCQRLSGHLEMQKQRIGGFPKHSLSLWLFIAQADVLPKADVLPAYLIILSTALWSCLVSSWSHLNLKHPNIHNFGKFFSLTAC